MTPHYHLQSLQPYTTNQNKVINNKGEKKRGHLTNTTHKMEGKGPRGRPRTRWINQIRKDIPSTPINIDTRNLTKKILNYRFDLKNVCTIYYWYNELQTIKKIIQNAVLGQMVAILNNVFVISSSLYQ